MMDWIFPGCRSLPADIDETPLPGELPVPYTERMALQKMLKSAKEVDETDFLIIGSDTTVYAEERILGKPGSAEEASKTLHFLNGKEHLVCTAVCAMRVRDGKREICRTVSETSVFFRNISEDEITRFVMSGSPMDKAGGYDIRDPQFHPARKVEGCYAGVIGFPLCHLKALLDALEFPLSADIQTLCKNGNYYECKFSPAVEIEKIPAEESEQME